MGCINGDANRRKKLVRKASSVIGGGIEVDFVGAIAERRMLTKVVSILNNTSHPLHDGPVRQKSTFSNRLISPKCFIERHRRSFLLAAIKLYISSPLCRNMRLG